MPASTSRLQQLQTSTSKAHSLQIITPHASQSSMHPGQFDLLHTAHSSKHRLQQLAEHALQAVVVLSSQAAHGMKMAGKVGGQKNIFFRLAFHDHSGIRQHITIVAQAAVRAVRDSDIATLHRMPTRILLQPNLSNCGLEGSCDRVRLVRVRRGRRQWRGVDAPRTASGVSPTDHLVPHLRDLCRRRLIQTHGRSKRADPQPTKCNQPWFDRNDKVE